jgi:hypothetical protein
MSEFWDLKLDTPVFWNVAEACGPGEETPGLTEAGYNNTTPEFGIVVDRVISRMPLMRSIISCGTWRLWVLLLAAGASGCAPVEPEDDRLRSFEPGALVPAGGVVTVNGKPVETLVVTFLPPNGPALGTAETDQDGKYELKSMAGPGVLPGQYTVAISYLESEAGEPQGLDARASLNQSAAMLSAKEKLPAEYADLGRSKLSATVGPEGGKFNFDVVAPSFAPKDKPVEKKVKEEAAPEKKAPPQAKPADGKPAEAKK